VARKQKKKAIAGNNSEGVAPAPPPQPSPSSCFDVCSYNGFINPLFNPQKVLLRRIFLLDSDRTKYVSVGIYPAMGYDALLKFGGCRQTPVLLKEPQFWTLAIHVPVLCVEMCNDRQYSSGSEKSEFTLSTTKQYRTARLKHGNKYIVYRLHDLQNLPRILYLAHEQQKFFRSPTRHLGLGHYCVDII
jgi:hypothetical protein